ncbi:hypothetical protein [Azotobacter beijerinckii]|uniref:PsiF repeat-containing protein n=1 Tax=Azotobacter beijerinckii TaxID=170623 RepID=A0A1I4GML3_9GAMM|nr:hypothetical protein [Azotobacter beijerinckii]SFL30401.1 hypothetical protein SAMN04244574_03885 [Azotobacter beijerinckii]
MRWKGALLATMLAAAGTAQAENYLKPLSDAFTDHIMGGLAEGKGGMATEAQKYVKGREIEKKEASRGQRRTVAECIKPGNVIDDDVNECVRGYKAKTW